MASAIFFLDHKLKPILHRDFRNDIPLSVVDEFPALKAEHLAPCFSKNGINYAYIEHSNIYLLALSNENIDIAGMFLFLHQLVAALQHFVKTVEEESVIDNFVILYELLDEMMDFGLVQNTDINLLQDYVTQASYQLEVSQALTALTDKISWRPPGIYYKKNELFVDVIETVSAIISTDGQVLSSNVTGKIAFKVFLSGMPTLRLGINDFWKSGLVNQDNIAKYRLSKYVKLEDLAFHQCVSLEEFEEDRTIQFIPPDGPFDLLTYRAPYKDQLPFDVRAKVEIKGHSRVLVKCTMTTNYKRRYSCAFAEFAIPVPNDCDTPRFKCQTGRVVYAPERNAVLWRVKEIPGGQTFKLTAELQIPAVGPIEMPTAPVQMKFEIPVLAQSGIQIRFLKVTEPQLKYNSYPWVRYTTKSGNYEMRLDKSGHPSRDQSREQSREPSERPETPSSPTSRVGLRPGGTRANSRATSRTPSEPPKSDDF